MSSSWYERHSLPTRYLPEPSTHDFSLLGRSQCQACAWLAAIWRSACSNTATG